MWLWEGTIKTVNNSLWDEPAEWVPEYRGEARLLTDMAKITDLFAMCAPEPIEDDDRESPGV